MDYGTAVFLAMIALTGLTSVIIYKINPRQRPTQTTDNYLRHQLNLLHEDNKIIIELLRKIEVGLSNLPSTTVVLPSVQNNDIEHSTRGKLSKRLVAAADWIVDNDPERKLSVRQIAKAANVSVGTAQAAIKLIEQEIGEQTPESK